MTAEQRKEHKRLKRLWATRQATRQQIFRCMALDRLAEAGAARQVPTSSPTGKAA